MLIYPKNKKGDQKDSLVWKEDNFLRLRVLRTQWSTRPTSRPRTARTC